MARVGKKHQPDAADTKVPCSLLQAEQMHVQQAMQTVASHRLHCEG